MPKTEELNHDSNMSILLRSCEEEIKEPLEGIVKGVVPSWLSGALIRNGPGTIKMGSTEYAHVFDGSALLHRFAIRDGKVTYQCRFLETETLKRNRKANRIVVTEFGTKSVPDPCHTIFDRISSIFDPMSYISDNAGISVQPFGDQVYAMTEVPTIFKIDPESLETLERKTLIDKMVVCHTSHPHIMPNGDVYNVAIQFFRGGWKHVIVRFPYKVEGDMFDAAEVVSAVEPRWRFSPTYMHSFGMTENYFILIEQPFALSTINILRNVFINKPFSSTMAWYPEYETQILLINRKTGVETRYRTDTFFFMHVVNSFENDGKVFIDVCTYKDEKIIDAMYVDAIRNMHSIPDYAQWSQTRPKRIEIPLDAPPLSKVEARLLADVGVEAPRINYDAYNGRPYKYFYGVGTEVIWKGEASIMKIDTITGEVKSWRESGASPSEPVFVARPDAKGEDDGVLLSALLWGKEDHAVTLVVLDARDLHEIARADFTTPSQVPNGLHGWYFPVINIVKY